MCGSFRSGDRGVFYPVSVAGSHEGAKDRVWLKRFGFELRVKLATEEEGMCRDLHDLDVGRVGRCASEPKAATGQNGLILTIELVTMAVTL